MPGQVRLGTGTFGFPGDVISVFGRTGAVIAQANDYSFAQLSGKPSTLAGYGITDGVSAADARLTNDRTANALRTLTSKGISPAADPVPGDVLGYQGGVWKPGSRDSVQGGATNQAGTTSATGVMVGVPGTVTPNFSNNVLVTICGQVKNTNAGCGAAIQIRHGTGTKPANGDGLGGTAVGAVVGFQGAGWGANQQVAFSVTALITTAAIGTVHWFDVSLAAVGGGTAQILQVAMTAHEF